MAIENGNTGEVGPIVPATTCSMLHPTLDRSELAAQFKSIVTMASPAEQDIIWECYRDLCLPRTRRSEVSHA